MEEYYRRRAREYEEIYFRDEPVRQKELKEISTRLRDVFRGRRVLDVACGTGFWTKVLSETATRMTAVDVTDEMLRIAENKNYRCPVDICRSDAFCLPFADGVFDGGMANFWISHVPKAQLDDFLSEFHRVLESGARIFVVDNMYVHGVGGELVTRVGDQNTYKMRKLNDGSEHLVLKNYYSVEELVALFGGYAAKLRRDDVSCGKCYWHVAYENR